MARQGVAEESGFPAIATRSLRDPPFGSCNYSTWIARLPILNNSRPPPRGDCLSGV